jgi:hypothetical protein
MNARFQATQITVTQQSLRTEAPRCSIFPVGCASLQKLRSDVESENHFTESETTLLKPS